MKLADKIEHISESDVLNVGREKINTFAIDPAMRAESNSIVAKDIANQSNQTSQEAKDIAENTDSRLDNIISNDMQDGEVIDARKPFGADAFPTLGDRIGSIDTILKNQKDYLNKKEQSERYNVVDLGFAVKTGRKNFLDIYHVDVDGLTNFVDGKYQIEIYFPNGLFEIEKGLYFKDSVSLRLATNAAITATAPMDYMLYLDRPNIVLTELYVEGGRFYGNKLAKKGIVCNKFNTLYIQNVIIRDITTIGIHALTGHDIKIYNVTLHNQIYTSEFDNDWDLSCGIYIESPVTDNTITNTTVVNFRVGYYIGSPANYMMNTCHWVQEEFIINSISYEIADGAFVIGTIMIADTTETAFKLNGSLFATQVRYLLNPIYNDYLSKDLTFIDNNISSNIQVDNVLLENNTTKKMSVIGAAETPFNFGKISIENIKFWGTGSFEKNIQVKNNAFMGSTTPTVTGTTRGTFSSDYSNLKYERNGHVVSFNLKVVGNCGDDFAGELVVTGLPFKNIEIANALSVRVWSQYLGSLNVLNAFILENESRIKLGAKAADGSPYTIRADDMKGKYINITISGSYLSYL